MQVGHTVPTSAFYKRLRPVRFVRAVVEGAEADRSLSLSRGLVA